jgi:hypothetical protein
MKNLTSLLLAGTFCFVGLGLSGCGGSQDNTVVQGEAPASSTSTPEAQAEYEAQMQREMAKSGGN